LHPWFVGGRSEGWLDTLRGHLEEWPRAGVGEVGLDRWIAGHDLAVQSEVLLQQLALAASLNRPVTLHCVRAWGALREALRLSPALPCGFLIHAYGGPIELVPEFADRGAYFSFSTSFLHPRKSAARDVFRRLPADRLLIETDAPSLAPPPEHNRFPLTDDATGESLNHPGNLGVALEGLAEVRASSLEEIARLTTENFMRLFGPGPPTT
jgi:TatD DNase family protein